VSSSLLELCGFKALILRSFSRFSMSPLQRLPFSGNDREKRCKTLLESVFKREGLIAFSLTANSRPGLVTTLDDLYQASLTGR
jgi:hypothetical protein